MTRKEIEERLIKEIAAITSMEPSAINPADPLHRLGIDSLGLVEIFVFIEKNFNLKLFEAGLTKNDLETVGALAAYVAGKIGAPSGRS